MADNSMKKVCTLGTFDLLHNGHKELLLEAAKLGDLHVIVVPSWVKRENNGYLPVKNENERRNDLIQFGKTEGGVAIVDIHIDCYEYGLKSLLSIRPDIMCFGYDQSDYWKRKLIRFLWANGMNPRVVTMPAYYNGLHSSDLRCCESAADAISHT